MNLIEFVAFIAGMLLLIVTRRNQRQRNNPEEVESEDEEQAERLREFLQQVNREMKTPAKKIPAESTRAPAAYKKPQNRKSEKPVFKEIGPLSYSSSMTKTDVHEENAFALKIKDPYAMVKEKESRVTGLFKRMKNRRDMVLLHEIFGPPKAMKGDDSYDTFSR